MANSDFNHKDLELNTIAAANPIVISTGVYPTAPPFRSSLSANPSIIFNKANETARQKKLRIEEFDELLTDKITRDTSQEAKLGRQRMALRAAYGEFMCTLLFYTPIFGSIVNGYLNNWSVTDITTTAAFVGGFQAVAISFAFSSVSGAHFNSAISFALWLTGKLSNRKAVMYIFVQLLASIIAMAIIAAMFNDVDGSLYSAYNSLAVQPPHSNPNLGKVFATEFFLTFFLTYIAFTVVYEDAEKQKKENMSIKTISDSQGLTLYASTPQSKTGFAPFAIGLTIFSLSLIGGESGGAFNPGRLLGPAIFSGKWDYLWLYWLGEVSGASFAGLLASNIYRFGLDTVKDEVSAKKALEEALEQAVDETPTTI